MAKLERKEEALRLRREGWLLPEIAATLEISKSTAGIWCREIELSERSRGLLCSRADSRQMKGRLIGAEMNRRKREERVQTSEEWARDQIGELTTRELLFTGIGLYWGEGAKDRKLNFTNSDPALLTFMKAWFMQVLEVDPKDFLIRVTMNESHHDRYEQVERFWRKRLGIPKSQFYRPTFVKTPHKKVYENRETYYGVVSLRIRKSTDLQYKILGLIKAAGNADVAQLVRASHS